MLEQGGELPLEWVLEGRFGSKGGAEKAFMSTSMNREEAAKYAARGVNPTLLQLRLGQVCACACAWQPRGLRVRCVCRGRSVR